MEDLLVQPFDLSDPTWFAMLAPPYEVVDTSVAREGYVRDVADEHKRPYETRDEGGDCEDWAAAEYHRRRAQGETGMMLIVGWDPALEDWHAVVYVRGELVDVLDVMSPMFRPLYAISETQAYRVIGQ